MAVPYSRNNPLLINFATEEEMLALPTIWPPQSKKILAFKTKFGYLTPERFIRALGYTPSGSLLEMIDFALEDSHGRTIPEDRLLLGKRYDALGEDAYSSEDNAQKYASERDRKGGKSSISELTPPLTPKQQYLDDIRRLQEMSQTIRREMSDRLFKLKLEENEEKKLAVSNGHEKPRDEAISNGQKQKSSEEPKKKKSRKDRSRSPPIYDDPPTFLLEKVKRDKSVNFEDTPKLKGKTKTSSPLLPEEEGHYRHDPLEDQFIKDLYKQYFQSSGSEESQSDKRTKNKSPSRSKKLDPKYRRHSPKSRHDDLSEELEHHKYSKHRQRSSSDSSRERRKSKRSSRSRYSSDESSSRERERRKSKRSSRSRYSSDESSSEKRERRRFSKPRHGSRHRSSKSHYYSPSPRRYDSPPGRHHKHRHQSNYYYSDSDSEAYSPERAYHRHGNPNKLPKNLKFDGSTKWLSFKQKFDSYRRVNRWTDEESRDYLNWSLEGKALDYFAITTEMGNHYSFKDIMRKLESRFGAKEIPETSRAKFRQAQQRSDETLEDWADRVMTLATPAFADLPEMHGRQEAISRFCQGCCDKEAGKHACFEHPRSIQEAVDLVRHYQFITQAVEGKKPKYRPEANVNIVSSSEKTDIAKLEEMVRNLTSRLEKVEQPTPARPKSDAKEAPTCYYCHKKGHYKKDCRALQKVMAAQRNGEKKPLNEKGHGEKAEPRRPNPQ